MKAAIHAISPFGTKPILIVTYRMNYVDFQNEFETQYS